MKANRMQSLSTLVLVAASLLALNSRVEAIDDTWTNLTSSTWHTPGNWSSGAPTSTFSTIYITNATTKTVTLNSSAPVSTLTISNLYLGGPSGTLNTLSVQAGLLTNFSIRNALTITSGGAYSQVGSTTRVDGVSSVSVAVYIDGGQATIGGGVFIATNMPFFYVGVLAPGGQLTINNGGIVYDPTGYVGGNLASSNNSVLVSGAGSVWNNSSNLRFGQSSVGNRMTITNGGKVYNAIAHVGYDSTSVSNSVLVTGTGSVWSNSGALYFGYNGAGNALTIASGGLVYNSGGGLGYNSSTSSNNTALVTGSGSVWSNSSDLYIGNYGRGNTLTIASGGKVYDSAGYVGFNGSSSNNNVLVTGSGSAWNNTSGLNVGYNGAGNTLTISNGAGVYNSMGIVGYGNNNNSVLVTGSGSVWSNSDLNVGYNGANNSLTISSSGTVYSAFAFVGRNNGSRGNSVLVTGTGSVWGSSSDLFVGNVGSQNTLTISNGGKVYNGRGYVGSDISSTNNSVLVTGGGSVWSNSSHLYVGNYGTGNTLTLADGGSVFALDVSVANNPNAGGTLTLDGGALITSNLFINTGGAFNYNQGTLTLSGALRLTGGTLNLATLLTLGSGGWSTNTIQFSSGTVAVTPTGVLRFSSDIASVGAAVVNQGILQVQASVFTFGGGFDNQANFALNANQLLTVQNGLANNGALIFQNGSVLSANSISEQTGSIYLPTAALLSVGSAWNNAGPISIQGGGMSGGTVNNADLIIGYGAITAPLVNQAGGTVRASGGLLSLNGTSAQNLSGAAFEIENGATLRIARPLANNGVINNLGGVFEVSNAALTNNSVLTGYGTFKAGTTINNGRALFNGGNVNVYGAYLNNASYTTEVRNITAAFYGAVTNNGIFKNTGSDLTFFGPYTGGFSSDPATTMFSGGLNLRLTDALVGGAGDVFVVSGDLTSANPAGLNLPDAKIVFNAGSHTFTIAGDANIGTLELDNNATVTLLGANLYVGLLSASPTQFTSSQTIYYDPTLNPALAGQTYALDGGGVVAAVPEPGTWLLTLLGLTATIVWRYRKPA